MTLLLREDSRPSLANLADRLLRPDALDALLPGEIPDGDGRRALELLWARALRAPIFDMLSRPSKRLRSRLVSAAWQMAGGQGSLPAGVAELVELVHVGSIIVDDIEDGSSSRRGQPALHVTLGVPLALNAGNFLYFAPLAKVEELGLPPAIEWLLLRRMARSMLSCHYGQALDLAARVDQLDRREVAVVVRATNSLKTGSLMELAARIGAIVARGTVDDERALGTFGRQLGIGLQMLDDLGNLRGTVAGKEHEDLRLGRVTWPWAWVAERCDDARFADLCAQAVLVQEGADPAPLAATLGTLIGEDGRAATRAHLARALGELRAAGFRTDEMAAEIERLERSYG